MGTRRGHGEGRIYQRKSDGRHIAAIDYGYVNGKRKRPAHSFKTRKEAAEKLRSCCATSSRACPRLRGG
jgi:hypothetical protein